MARPEAGPAVRERDDQSEGTFCLSDEQIMYSQTSFAVPLRGIDIFVGGIGMEGKLSGFHELAARLVS